MNSACATAMPIMQLSEFKHIIEFSGMVVRTNNSEFSHRKAKIARRKLRNKNNTGEIGILEEQEIWIPTFDGFGIESSDSNV